MWVVGGEVRRRQKTSPCQHLTLSSRPVLLCATSVASVHWRVCSQRQKRKRLLDVTGKSAVTGNAFRFSLLLRHAIDEGEDTFVTSASLASVLFVNVLKAQVSNHNCLTVRNLRTYNFCNSDAARDRITFLNYPLHTERENKLTHQQYVHQTSA
jgi:hypothetical protein